jgi:hypothetical protein
VRINLIVLGFAAMNRLHIERMTQHKSKAFSLTQVCEPIPREHTFDADDDILSNEF